MSDEAVASPAASQNALPPSGGDKKSCMPDNPFLPDSLFGDNKDKIKAHVGIFVALVVGLRLIGMFMNSEAAGSHLDSLNKCKRKG